MPWTDAARRDHARRMLRYASDMTDGEWALIAPFLPPPRRIGRPREADLRAVVDAILHLASSGCQWRMLPRDFPPVSTVQRYFYAWRDEGLWAEIGAALVAHARTLAGRDIQPTAGVIDRRASERHWFEPTGERVKTTEAGGPCGYDAGKRIRGRKRHIVTDTLGLVVAALVHPANIQDRDGAPDTLKAVRTRWPQLRHVFADGGYAGPKLRGALAERAGWTIEIVKRSGTVKGFEVLPRRWVVERSFAWLGRCRRLAKDWERTITSATAFLLIAHIRILIRRIARLSNA